MEIIAYLVGGFWLILILRYILRTPFKWATSKVSACLTALSKIAGTIMFFVLRGRLIVQASTYLMALAQPYATPETANRTAHSIDTFAAMQLITGALHHSNELFNGSRLALISEARLQGFSG